MVRRTWLITCSLYLFISFDFQPISPALNVRSFLGLWFTEVAASTRLSNAFKNTWMFFRPLPCEVDMDGKRVRAVACGSTHTACLVTRAWVSDDLIKNCMACKTKFSLVNRKVRVFFLFLSTLSFQSTLRACLHGCGGPQVGEVTR